MNEYIVTIKRINIEDKLYKNYGLYVVDTFHLELITKNKKGQILNKEKLNFENREELIQYIIKLVRSFEPRNADINNKVFTVCMEINESDKKIYLNENVFLKFCYEDGLFDKIKHLFEYDSELAYDYDLKDCIVFLQDATETEIDMTLIGGILMDINVNIKHYENELI